MPDHNQLDHDDAVRSRMKLRRAVRPDVLPLSFAQARMWLADQIDEGGSAYNLPVALRLRGALDVPALRAALADVAERHESLRTAFPEEKGVPRQEILSGAAGCPELAVSRVQAGELDGAVAAVASEGFDLAAGLPWRAHLFVMSEDEHVLVLVVHHIAGDGWSMGVLAADISAAYAARLEGRAPGWAPLPVQYADYAVWQRDWLGDAADPGSVMAGQLGFWREALAGAPAELALPADRPRPAVRSYRGGQVPFGTSAEVHAGIVAAARGSRATVSMVAQAAVAVLLARLGAGTDIPVGMAVAGRGHQALDELVGFFVNALVLRTDVAGDPSLADVIARVRQADLAAFAHQDLPFEQLVDALAPERSLARNPLFQVMLAFQNGPEQDWQLPGLDVSPVPAGTGGARFDLLFNVWEQRAREGAPAGLAGILEFAADLFDAGTAEAIAGRLVRILEQVAADPEVRVSQVELLDAAERRQLVEQWAKTPVPVPVPGLPAAGARVFVLDEWLAPVPAGVAGELYVAGPGVTGERPVACPFGSGEVMYRTGDRARWTADGRLVVAGRPEADRAALPVPERDGLEAPAGTREPGSVTEEVLCGLFAEVLGVDGVGPQSSFFELGADSLLAPRLVAQIQAVLGAEVTLRDLFEHPVVAELAAVADRLRGDLADLARVAGRGTAVRPPLRPVPRPAVVPLSFAQVRMWFLDQLEGGAAYNISVSLRLAGRSTRPRSSRRWPMWPDVTRALRTIFPADGGEPRQQILDPDEGRPKLVASPGRRGGAGHGRGPRRRDGV